MNLIIIYTHEDHLELANAMVDGIKERYGIDGKIFQKDSVKSFNDNDLYILVDLHHFHSDKVVPKKFIMYNFLQAECRQGKSLRIKNLAEKSIQLWDYSKVNLEFFSKHFIGINPVYVPFGYSETYEVSNLKEAGNIEKIRAVGFLGDFKKPRRRKIFDAIKRKTGHSVSSSPIKIFGDAKAKFLRETKIMLNVHKIDTAKILETARLVTLLSNGCFIISEKSIDKDLMEVYKGKVIFADATKIPDLVDYYLKNEEERENFAKKAYEWFKTEYRTSQFIPDVPKIMKECS